MRHTSNEKRKTTHDGRNRTAKSRKNQDIRRRGNVQILWSIGSWHHQTNRDEGKPQENKKNTRNQTILQGDFIKGINTWAFHLVRYSGPFFKWTREEFKLDQRTRKLITIHKALHPKDNVGRLYVSRKEGLNSIEDSVDASIQRLEDLIKKRGGRLVTASRNNSDNTRSNRTETTRNQKWEEKQLYGRFKRLTVTSHTRRYGRGLKRKP